MIEPALRLPVARGPAGTKRWHRTSRMLSIVGERERARCNNQMLVCNDRFIWALHICTWIGTTLQTSVLETKLRVLGHRYCAALKECADLGFVVN